MRKADQPAFPCSASQPGGQAIYPGSKGMTLLQYAAIKLRVPESGDDWLDDMILESLRNEFAAKAMQQTMVEFDDAWSDHAYQKDEFWQWAAERSYAMADAMLKAREQ